MSKSQKILILICALAAFSLRGCDECSCFGSKVGGLAGYYAQRAGAAQLNPREQYVYIGNIPPAGKGKPFAIFQVQSLATRAQGILFLGNLLVKGKITPQVAGTPIPTQLRAVFKQIDPHHKTLFTRTYDIRVQNNGVISPQTLPVTEFSIVNLKDVLFVSLFSVDRNLPPCRGTLNITFRTLASSSIDTEDEPVEGAALVQRQQFTFVGFIGAGPKNVVAGAIGVKSIKGPLLTLNGDFHIKGKITPQTPGTHLPSKIRVVIKHKAPNGTVLSTDTFDINVQSNGAILSQTFPFKTVNASNIRESLELSVMPLGTNFPDCTANLTASFTALPGT